MLANLAIVDNDNVRCSNAPMPRADLARVPSPTADHRTPTPLPADPVHAPRFTHRRPAAPDGWPLAIDPEETPTCPPSAKPCLPPSPSQLPR